MSFLPSPPYTLLPLIGDEAVEYRSVPGKPHRIGPNRRIDLASASDFSIDIYRLTDDGERQMVWAAIIAFGYPYSWVVPDAYRLDDILLVIHPGEEPGSGADPSVHIGDFWEA